MSYSHNFLTTWFLSVRSRLPRSMKIMRVLIVLAVTLYYLQSVLPPTRGSGPCWTSALNAAIVAKPPLSIKDEVMADLTQNLGLTILSLVVRTLSRILRRARLPPLAAGELPTRLSPVGSATETRESITITIKVLKTISRDTRPPSAPVTEFAVPLAVVHPLPLAVPVGIPSPRRPDPRHTGHLCSRLGRLLSGLVRAVRRCLRVPPPRPCTIRREG